LGQQRPGTCVLSVLFPVPTSYTWGGVGWGGGLGQQRPGTCVLNVLFLCLRHTFEVGFVGGGLGQ